jgi:hypothetical protein
LAEADKKDVDEVPPFVEKPIPAYALEVKTMDPVAVKTVSISAVRAVNCTVQGLLSSQTFAAFVMGADLTMEPRSWVMLGEVSTFTVQVLLLVLVAVDVK